MMTMTLVRSETLSTDTLDGDQSEVSKNTVTSSLNRKTRIAQTNSNSSSSSSSSSSSKQQQQQEINHARLHGQGHFGQH
jgi:hypothetical protein